jgi:elongation factor 1 alpha-like protein
MCDTAYLCPGYLILGVVQVTMHAHAARESGHISALGPLLDPRTGEVAKPRPRVLTKGQTSMIELTLARSLPVELYSDLRALGRIALREKGRTLAVGIVTAILE